MVADVAGDTVYQTEYGAGKHLRPLEYRRLLTISRIGGPRTAQHRGAPSGNPEARNKSGGQQRATKEQAPHEQYRCYTHRYNTPTERTTSWILNQTPETTAP